MAASVECNLREQHALDTAGVGIVYIRQRVIVRCNRRCADIFGYPDEHALVGVGSEQLHPSRGDLRSLGREAYTTLSAGHAYRTQRRLRRKDGSLWSVEVSATFRKETGREFFVFLRDITERKRAEQELEQHRHSLQELVKQRTSGRVEIQVFANSQLGGVGDYMCSLVASGLGIKARYDKPGTIQRVSAALASLGRCPAAIDQIGRAHV